MQNLKRNDTNELVYRTETGSQTVFPGGSVAKNPPAKQLTWVQSLGWEDPLEKEIATHSSILAWQISWTGSLAGYNPWDNKELNTTQRLSNNNAIRVEETNIGIQELSE